MSLVKKCSVCLKRGTVGVNLASGLIQDPGNGPNCCGQPDQQDQSTPPLEIEWKRKDGTTLKIQFSGQKSWGAGRARRHEVITEVSPNSVSWRIICVNRQLADPLTGLANYRHLAEVLDMEIKRFRAHRRELPCCYLTWMD